MNLQDIVLEGREPVSLSVLKNIEKNLGVLFPDSFKKVVLYKDCARFKKQAFVFKEAVSQEEIEGCLGGILSFQPILGELDIVWYNSKLKRQIGDGFVPFIKDPGGDLICFDYRKDNSKSHPSIVYWSHESPDGEDISYIADNFDEFINMLF